jgi:hypothetical protein
VVVLVGSRHCLAKNGRCLSGGPAPTGASMRQRNKEDGIWVLFIMVVAIISNNLPYAKVRTCGFLGEGRSWSPGVQKEK